MKNTVQSIRVYSSPEKAFLVNSFIIETDNGVVVIDTQFLVSTARELKQKVDEMGKPLLAVIVSHPHPDHFNGTIVLCEEKDELPVYATEATLNGIKITEAEKREFWKQSYGDDYPNQTFFPNQILQPKDELTIDNVRFTIDELGAGESTTNSVIYLPDQKVLFASDMVYAQAHPWLAEGRSKAWLKQLEYLKANYSDAQIVYAGHGGKTSFEAFDEQANYIKEFTELVQMEASNSGTLTAEQKRLIQTAMQKRYENFGLEFLIEMNADGLAKELAA